MRNIILLFCVAASIVACKNDKPELDVYKQLEEMRGMTIAERGKAFADKVTEYMDANDSIQERILQDSTMAWANTLRRRQQDSLAVAIENEYKAIAYNKAVNAK